MAPLGDTVSFVNGDSGQLALSINRLHIPTKCLSERIFRCYVKESGSGVSLKNRHVSYLNNCQRILNTAAQVIENSCTISEKSA